MFKNEIMTALRAIREFRFYSALKILGLALGIACCLIIFLFVQQELSFDRFHAKADRIFRLEELMKLDIGEKPYSIVSSKILPALLADCPDVENGVRLRDYDFLIRGGDNTFQVAAKFADASLFDVFTFPLIAGNPNSALASPLSAVLTEHLAANLLPGRNPVGQTLRLDNKTDVVVSGLMKDIPVNSHIQADLFVSYSSLKSMTGDEFSLDDNYLLLRDKNAAARVEKFLPGFVERRMGKRAAANNRYFLRPLTAIYFNSNAVFDLGKKSEAKYSYYLALLGVFILALAVINVINLTMANALKRLKEVGVRKIVGAGRGQIIRHFLIESFVLASGGAALAVLLAQGILPFFNQLARRRLELDWGRNPGLVLGLIGVLVLTALAAGIYPALTLSSMKITDMIRRKTGSRPGRANVRRIFVVIQFAVCILFLVGTLTAIRQLRFVAHKDLGFARENLLLTPIGRMGVRAEAFRDELLTNPEIVGVSLAAVIPGEDFDWPRLVLPEGAAADEAMKIPVFSADAQCFPTLGVPIVDGRNFLDGPGDRGRAAIINQAAARKFGWTSPIGKRLSFPDDHREAVVVGVVKDFNLESLHKDIGPYVFTSATENYWEAVVRVKSSRLSQTIQFIKAARRKIAPDDVLDVEFVDEKIAAAYREDERTQKILTLASALAVTIACLGLLGLAAFAAESRIKEIGIRKTLGASAPSVVALLGKEFALCVLAANLLAWPAAAVLVKSWLRNFAFRVPLSWGTFVLAAAVALLIAMLVVAYQAVKAALADPVDSLRYE